MFVSDLPSNLNCSARLFADDCLLYVAIVDPSLDNKILQDDLYIVLRNGSQCTWQVEFNATKCYTLCVSLKREPPVAEFYYCGKFLEHVESHSHLGVDGDNRLRWKDHVNQICTAANRMLGLVLRKFLVLYGQH